MANALVAARKIAIELFHDESDLLYMMMGKYLMQDQKFTEEAIQYIKSSLRINNRNTYSWFLLADLYSENDPPLNAFILRTSFISIGFTSYLYVSYCLKFRI